MNTVPKLNPPIWLNASQTKTQGGAGLPFTLNPQVKLNPF